MRKILMTIILTVLSCSCTKRIEVNGIVTSVEYRKAFTTTTIMPVYAGKVTVLMPQTIHHDEAYSATVIYGDSLVTKRDFREPVSIGDTVVITVKRIDND